MKRIAEIKDTLEINIENRRRFKRTYSRATKVINISEGIAPTATAGLSTSGVVLLSTIAAIPVVIAFESASLGFSLLGVTLKIGNKKNLV